MAIKPIKSSIEVVGRGAHEWENVQAINENFAELAGGGGGNTSVTVDSITDATTVGKNVLKAADAAAVRTVIGAGTSNLTIGTTASTAKAGNYVPTWAEVSSKPAVIAAGADQAAARTVLGLGTLATANTVAYASVTGVPTANTTAAGIVQLGTGATNAATGNHTHTAATTSAAGFMSAADKTKLDGVATGATNFTAANATAAVAAKTQIAALVSPTADYADLTEATAAIKSIIDALKA